MATRFELRYGWFRWLLSILGTGPRWSGVDIDRRGVKVTMGWAFRTRIPLASVTSVERDRDMRWGIGVHGWRGRWLVNGSVKGIVTIGIEPPARARVIGFPVRLRTLHVSVTDPGALVAALARSTA
ncbi:MAG: hypothetical protein S0880_20700 [Actinomycetota bacterium]|nr:hypothetical protein [Actinomycetota bacterium]